MPSIIYSPKEIFEQDFKKTMRGYDPNEVDSFLDNIIKDYESFTAQLEALRKENAELRSELNEARLGQTQPAVDVVREPYFGDTAPVTATNFDILKRISRLEKEVFGKQIVE